MKSGLFTLLLITTVSQYCDAQEPIPISTNNKHHSVTPRFIEGFVLPRDGSNDDSNEGSTLTNLTPASRHANYSSSSIEKSKPIQFKYALLMDREVESIQNLTLYSFVDKWRHVSYRLGGTSENGIDCSAFTEKLNKEVYGFDLPRTAKEQYNSCMPIKLRNAKEGDMVFFSSKGRISHVGVYLGEGFFVHASTSNGVTISNLDDPYYKSRFTGTRRVKSELDAELTSTQTFKSETR